VVDWLKIRNEYINGCGSYRSISEKYGIPFGTVRSRAEKEEWVKLRKEQMQVLIQKTAQKTAEVLSDREADRLSRILTMADRLSDQLDQAITELDQQLVRQKKKQRVVEYNDPAAPGKPTKETVDEIEELEVVEGPIDRLGLQQLTTALKNLKEVISDAEAAVPPADGEDDPLTAALKEEFF